MEIYEEIFEKKLSQFGKGSKLKGEFFLKGTARISSEVEGVLRILDKGALIIDREGIFRGEIYCHNIEIFGEFHGIINSTGLAIMRPASNVSGEINARQLSVSAGAQVNIKGETILEEKVLLTAKKGSA